VGLRVRGPRSRQTRLAAGSTDREGAAGGDEEMSCLIDDITRTGAASTRQAAHEGSVPNYEVSPETVCDPD